MNNCSGGSKGAQGMRAPPGGPNSFNFMQFLGNFGKIVCWRPPGELAPPPRGNPGSATELDLPPSGKSWIRRWQQIFCEVPLPGENYISLNSTISLYLTCFKVGSSLIVKRESYEKKKQKPKNTGTRKKTKKRKKKKPKKNRRKKKKRKKKKFPLRSTFYVVFLDWYLWTPSLFFKKNFFSSKTLPDLRLTRRPSTQNVQPTNRWKKNILERKLIMWPFSPQKLDEID